MYGGSFETDIDTNTEHKIRLSHIHINNNLRKVLTILQIL